MKELNFELQLHYRKSVRLKEYDYSKGGYYFVTICTFNRMNLFGKVNNQKIELNQFGKIIEEELIKSPIVRKEIKIDYYSIMPNHLHCIVIIEEEYRKGERPFAPTLNASLFKLKPRTLASFISGFKSVSTKKVNEIRKTPGEKVWHRNYYEHVIRNEKDLYEIRKYIQNNPLEWEEDEYYKE